VSFGLAANKLVAGIASKLRKPRGFVVVPAGAEAAFLAPLEIGRLPGIGLKTESALKARGIQQLRDLFTRTESELHALFGDGWRGVMAAARGEDDSRSIRSRRMPNLIHNRKRLPRILAMRGTIERVARSG